LELRALLSREPERLTLTLVGERTQPFDDLGVELLE